MGPQEDYIETVFTCEGDYHDPHLKDRLEDFQKSLKDLLLTDKKKLILKKVEPWNSVRVTFKIPREAASRLKQLAQQGNSTLRDLGVLAVKIEDQNISLTIAGRNNERTQLVFRTADTIPATSPSVSVYNPNIPSPQGPGPSNIDATSKNIADYLRQGSLLDSFFNPQAIESARAKVNNILSEHGVGQHRTFQQTASQPSHHNPSNSSTTVNSVSPSRSPVSSGGMKFPQIPGMPPGLAQGLPPGPPRHSLDNLPPPPPYPEGSSYMNNLQKLRLGTAGASPLLVNLLQTDPAMASFLGAGRLPPTLDPDSLQPPKKKRKPRKPREKKKKEGEQISVPNSVISTSSSVTESVSPAVTSTHTVSSYVGHSVTPSYKEQNFLNVSQALLRGQNIDSEQHNVNVPLTSPGILKREECDTAGKIINPVTGLLEPMDLSDTSPAKSEGDRNSPRSLTNRTAHIGDSKSENRQADLSHMLTIQGRLDIPNQGIQRQHSELLNPHSVPAVERNIGSSHSSSEVWRQKQMSEAVKNDVLVKSRLKNDIMPSLSNLEQSVPKNNNQEVKTERQSGKCDNSSALELTKKTDSSKNERVPQETNPRSIPLQLLNKPLLQVKHDSIAKPSGSPDSNGDSECSNLDTQNGQETGIPAGPHADHRSYNNDSGVGSCSERSDDTPSEHGDNDFKSGNHNSFECAKTPGIDTLKQTPTSKVMTVGYALEETQKNHKLVSEKDILNSVLDRAKLKAEKMELCSTSQSQQLYNLVGEDPLRFSNSVEASVKRAVYESIHRKSPKLSAALPPNSLHHSVEGHLPMQGTETTMQKKKSSPRNSPRGGGSPRNPSSPRNPGSPRGAGSPRSLDTVQVGTSHPSFRTGQDGGGVHMSSRESLSKSPYSDLGKHHTEHRRSPFHMLTTAQSVAAAASSMAGLLGANMNHVGVEPRHVLPQCNIDSIALLKSIDAYAQPHLNQLNIMATNKDPGFMQKLEELKPLFQRLQQHAAAAQRSAATSIPNGLETGNHSSRSPGPLGQIKASSLGSNVPEMHPVIENSAVPNSLHAGPCTTTNVLTALKNENDTNSAHSSISKVSRVNMEEQKSTSVSARRSPGAASTTPASMHPFDSSLPPPKRLTESVQKLFPLPLLDNSTSLPHVNRRSPSNSASVTRTSTNHNNSAGQRGLASFMSVPNTASKNCSSDVSVFDIDHITPTITGTDFGPIDFHIDTSHKLDIDTITSMPSLTLCRNAVSSSSTKLVPAVTGSIPSHKMDESGISSLRANISQCNDLHSELNTSSSNNNTSEIITTVCNSENKMASSSSIQAGSTNLTVNSPVLGPAGPPVLRPQNVRYPVQSLEMRKSPIQHMGLSQMLQETANLNASGVIQSNSSQTVQALQSTETEHLNTAHGQAHSEPEQVVTSNFVERLKSNVETQLKESNSLVDSQQASQCESSSKQQSNANVKSGGDDSDIPKLKRQPSLSFSKSKEAHTPRSALGSDSCDSDLNKSQDSGSSNLTPPVLTAVSEVNSLITEASHPEKIENDRLQSGTNFDVQSSAGPDFVTTGNGSVHENTNQSVDINDDAPPTLSLCNEKNQLTEANSIYEDSEASQSSISVQRQLKTLRKRRASSESIDEKSDEAPRQLRSRKRTNNSDNNDSNASDDTKRLKLETNVVETPQKSESAKDNKNVLSSKSSTVSCLQDTKPVEEQNSSTEVKVGLRTRTNSKNIPEEKPKPPLVKDSKKDTSKVIASKTAPEKKVEVIKAEELKRSQQARRNRLSPPALPSEKAAATPAVREKSPVRGSRTRGRNSPLTVDNSEESQENKRTTRSAKSKETKVEPASQPAVKVATSQQAVKVTAGSKRRRTSQDHR